MPEDKKTSKAPHSIILENRSVLNATGVSNVDSFDDQTVVADTDYGGLVVHGNALSVSRLSVESGELTISGEIYSVSYTQTRSSGSVLSRIFR